MRTPTLLYSVLPILLLLPTGCGPGTPTRPESAPRSRAVLAGSIDQVAGAWSWTRTEQLTIPEWFAAAVLGIEPEGRYTHARCTLSGSMHLIQSGSSFHGVALTTEQRCWTRGGQGFTSPGLGLPVVVAEGSVHGAAVRFVLRTPVVSPCPYHATLRPGGGAEDATMSGSGRCVLPGHPRSEAAPSLPPPPGGTSVTLDFLAVRADG